MSKTIDDILKGFGNWTLDEYEPLTAYKDVPALTLQESKQAIREAIERSRPNSEMLATTTNRPETIFGFDAGVRVFERNLLKELGLDDAPTTE